MPSNTLDVGEWRSALAQGCPSSTGIVICASLGNLNCDLSFFSHYSFSHLPLILISSFSFHPSLPPSSHLPPPSLLPPSPPPSLCACLSHSPYSRDVGMVKEAEQLLCDVVSLHSVQRWPQLSSSAYSILASCQKRLRQEDKYPCAANHCVLVCSVYG